MVVPDIVKELEEEIDYAKSLDEFVKEFQGYIFAELTLNKPDETRIADYVRTIMVANEKFDSNYTTNLEKYKAEMESYLTIPNYLDRLPLKN